MGRRWRDAIWDFRFGIWKRGDRSDGKSFGLPMWNKYRAHNNPDEELQQWAQE